MKILNFGSTNIDTTFAVDHIVQPGETISSFGMYVNAGGKGLNQSFALGRAGAEVYHGGLIGNDGAFLRDVLLSAGVNCDYLYETDLRSKGVRNSGNVTDGELLKELIFKVIH